MPEAEDTLTTGRVGTLATSPSEPTASWIPQSSDLATVVGVVQSIMGGDQGGDRGDSGSGLTCGAWWRSD